MRPGPATTELLTLTGWQESGAARCLLEQSPRLPDRARWLSHLATDPAERSKGHASRLLAMLAGLADAAGIALLLNPRVEDDQGLDAQQLERFYRTRGFVTLQKEPLVLVRPPKR